MDQQYPTKSYRDIFRNNKTATVTQVVDQELCWFQTRLFHTRIDNQVNTTIFTAPAQKGPITFSYNIACEVQEEEMASQFFLPLIGFEEQPVTCASGTISLIANVLTVTTAYLILFLRNLCIISTLILNAPWFHFCVLLELIFRLFSGFSISGHTASRSGHTPSRFQLLVRLRMAIGMHRVKRLSYVGLLRLYNSPAPSHSLEAICGNFTGTTTLYTEEHGIV